MSKLNLKKPKIIEKSKNKVFEINLEKINSPAIKNMLIRISKKNEIDSKKDNTEIQIVITKRKNTSKPILRVSNLTKVFKIKKTKKVAVSDFSFELYAGEHIAILGANGAGKTTSVEIIAGLNKPTSGKIEYLYEYKNNFLEEIGIQFQDANFPSGITVKQVVSFMIHVYKVKINIHELNGLINIFGIDEFYKNTAQNLSGGEKQRLNALLSIIHKPKIVFLDELSTGLDIKIRNKIKEFILDFANENGMTIVLVSHDMSEVDTIADRIIIMQKGNLVVNEYKDTIKKEYGDLEKFVDSYLN